MAEDVEVQEISLAALRRVLSEPRLEAYRHDAAEPSSTVVGRYRWNIALSMALYPGLQQLEVALRNNLHVAISGSYGQQWYDSTPPFLTQRELQSVVAAKEELKKQMKPSDPNRLVAELRLGFWTSLVSRDYERLLWPHMLGKAFPYIPRRLRTRATISARLQDIRKLRNRISHQEPIFKLPLQRLHVEILDTISWMAPALLRLIPVGESFEDIHARGPSGYELRVIRSRPQTAVERCDETRPRLDDVAQRCSMANSPACVRCELFFRGHARVQICAEARRGFDRNRRHQRGRH